MQVLCFYLVEHMLQIVIDTYAIPFIDCCFVMKIQCVNKLYIHYFVVKSQQKHKMYHKWAIERKTQDMVNFLSIAVI